MQGQTYKCKSCGGYLTFDPNSQKWLCPYCQSTFTQEDLQKDPISQGANDESEQTQSTSCEYHCTSCGSQIVTDETTVATHCYYCHSPVVLQSKLTQGKKPDSVLPFALDQNRAKAEFANWIQKKRYVPKSFFDMSKMENLSGVYFPHFATQIEANASVEGTGERDQVYRDNKFTTTHTSHYHIRRSGTVLFQNIMRPALSSANRKLSDGIHPFPLEQVEPFSGAYLSGFMAECKDVEPQDATQDIPQEIEPYAKALLSKNLSYDRLSLNASVTPTHQETSYMLLPTWVMTYPNEKDIHDPYYYAMNGVTGKVCGKLPINRKKLCLDAGLIFAICYGLAMFICYLV